MWTDLYDSDIERMLGPNEPTLPKKYTRFVHRIFDRTQHISPNPYPEMISPSPIESRTGWLRSL
jgi:hypothetical protein